MLEVLGINKFYGGRLLLNNISFNLAEAETICLLGPSGSGKSTLLRIIAGLEVPDGGQILWQGMDLVSIPAHLRDFGFVFQDYALFPHLTVVDNIAFGLKMKHWPQAELDTRVHEVIRMVNLQDFEERQVNDLSGGEQQRVALARALAPRPRLLMFDEPLGALDRALREDLLNELRRILLLTRIPAMYVTHDQEEAFAIADRILLLHAGEIVQDGIPSEVWGNPASVWEAEFLGLGNVFAGKIIAKGWKINTKYGTFALECRHKHQIGDEVMLLARPNPQKTGTKIQAIVKDILFQKNGYKAVLDNGLTVNLPSLAIIGQTISLHLGAECLG